MACLRFASAAWKGNLSARPPFANRFATRAIRSKKIEHHHAPPLRYSRILDFAVLGIAAPDFAERTVAAEFAGGSDVELAERTAVVLAGRTAVVELAGRTAAVELAERTVVVLAGRTAAVELAERTVVVELAERTVVALAERTAVAASLKTKL